MFIFCFFAVNLETAMNSSYLKINFQNSSRDSFDPSLEDMSAELFMKYIYIYISVMTIYIDVIIPICELCKQTFSNFSEIYNTYLIYTKI